VEVTGNLKEIYEDKDGQRREEVAALSGPNEFGEFYARDRFYATWFRPENFSVKFYP
jgi:splicing factor 3A subunit 3